MPTHTVSCYMSYLSLMTGSHRGSCIIIRRGTCTNEVRPCRIVYGTNSKGHNKTRRPDMATRHAENNTPRHEATVPSHALTHAQPLTLFTTTLSSAAPKPCVSWTLLLIHPLLHYPRSHAPTAARAPSRRIRGLRSRCRAASAPARTRILTSLACARPRAEA
jgi:hypothetical protein